MIMECYKIKNFLINGIKGLLFIYIQMIIIISILYMFDMNIYFNTNELMGVNLLSINIEKNKESTVRIGIDLGGTKTEVIALGDAGEQLYRHRLPTPRDDYRQTIETIATLVDMAEQATGQRGTVGMGIPGSISPHTGVVKNANSTWLNGQPFDKDLSARLQREVRLANDANCLAVSEAVDGAAAGAQTVFAVIIGTGCGAGVAFKLCAALDGCPPAAMARQVSGDTIRYRGWTKTNCVIARKSLVIAVNKVVLKPLFRARDSRWIIVV